MSHQSFNIALSVDWILKRKHRDTQDCHIYFFFPVLHIWNLSCVDLCYYRTRMMIWVFAIRSKVWHWKRKHWHCNTCKLVLKFCYFSFLLSDVLFNDNFLDDFFFWQWCFHFTFCQPFGGDWGREYSPPSWFKMQTQFNKMATLAR